MQGITTQHGAELLIHVGLDTVNLNGKGFEVMSSVNKKVKAGDPILKLDLDYMKENDIDLTMPMVLTNGDEYDLSKITYEGECTTNTVMMKITKK